MSDIKLMRVTQQTVITEVTVWGMNEADAIRMKKMTNAVTSAAQRPLTR